MKLARFVALFALVVCVGCATTGNGGSEGDPRDPLEPMNRAIFSFNEGLDRAVLKPIATGYRDTVPDPVRGWVRNFFSNIGDIFIGFNNILQGKPDEGLQDWVRFAVNTFFGVFGINDVASDMGLEKHDEDFGQTFGRWGVGDGPYLVLPLFGPSTLRDGVGKGIDLYVDPVGEVKGNGVRNTAIVTRAVSTRADLLDAGKLLEEAALDRYVFLRDAYLQRRRSQIHDGHPPREPRERDEDAEPKDGKRGVNEVAPPAVETSMPGNVYLPRIPANYEAIMATLKQDHAQTR